MTDSPYQVQLVGGAGPLQASALQTMLNDIQGAAASHQQAQMRCVWEKAACGRVPLPPAACLSLAVAPCLPAVHGCPPPAAHARRFAWPLCSVRRRQGAEGERVLFRAGQVMRHRRYHYRCAALT